MTLLISLSICFLLRCLNRCSSHRSIIPESSFSSDSFRFSNHRVSPETERTSSVLDSLPVFKFSSVTRRSNNNNNNTSSSDSNDCAVCLSKFEPEDQLRLLPRCCHAFHKDCIDVWLLSNQTCPLCRSPLFVSESEITKSGNERDNSFRLEIGSISRRGRGENVLEASNRSYSIGSFDYIVDDVESEISESNLNRKREEAVREIAIRETAVAVESSLAAEIGNNEGSRSWLKEYVDRISSRAASFRSSGRFFTGSSRRSEEVMVVDLEANQAGEEISEIFRWLSGV